MLYAGGPMSLLLTFCHRHWNVITRMPTLTPPPTAHTYCVAAAAVVLLLCLLLLLHLLLHLLFVLIIVVVVAFVTFLVLFIDVVVADLEVLLFSIPLLLQVIIVEVLFLQSRLFIVLLIVILFHRHTQKLLGHHSSTPWASMSSPSRMFEGVVVRLDDRLVLVRQDIPRHRIQQLLGRGRGPCI
jgi:hypothetical protein